MRDLHLLYHSINEDVAVCSLPNCIHEQLVALGHVVIDDGLALPSGSKTTARSHSGNHYTEVTLHEVTLESVPLSCRDTTAIFPY